MSETPEAFTYDPGNPENRTHTETDLNGAILSVNSKKMSILDAANTFQVPILTLWNKVLDIKIEEQEEEILTPQEEAKIARILRETTDYGCHPSMEDLLYTVKSVLEEKGQFSTFKHKLGKDWILGFLERHKGITLKPTGGSAQSTSSTKSSKMVLLDDKNIFLDCSIKKERSSEGLSPEDALQKAIVEVKLHGMNVFAAAKLHNVSPATLWDEVSGRDAASMPKPGYSSTTLNADEEEEIADMLRKAIAKGLEVTRNDLRETVKATLDSKGRITRFINNKPSKWWVPSFLSRHPGINLKEFSCRSTSTKRSSDTAQGSENEPAVAVSNCILSSSSPATESNQPLSDKPSSKSSTVSSTSSHEVVSIGCGSAMSTANGDFQDRHHCNSHTSSAVAQALTAANKHTFNSLIAISSTSSSCKSQVSECNTVFSSATAISNVMTVMSSTKSHARPLSAYSHSDGAALNGPKISTLTEKGTSHARTGSLLSGSTQNSCQNTEMIDSTLSLLKRFTMINFSLGEERVLKFLSYLDRGENINDVDYYYWKSLIWRIMPSFHGAPSSVPASHQQSQSHSEPSNTACHSAQSFDRFHSQPLPHSHDSQARNFDSNKMNYNSNYHRNYNKQPRFYKGRNFQPWHHQSKKAGTGDHNTEPQEASEVTHKKNTKKKDYSNEPAEVKKRKKEPTETRHESLDDQEKTPPKTSKNPKKKRKVEDGSDVEGNDVTEGRSSKKSAKRDKGKDKKSEKKKVKKAKKKEKENLASVRDEENEDEINKKKKKKKKEKRKVEKKNPVIRVEVDMSRGNKRTVFNDSSSEE